MRLLALLALVAIPSAGGASFVALDAPTPSCGEGCLDLEGASRVVALTPAPGARVVFVAEDAAGLPVASGVVLERTVLELPESAARLRVRPL